VSSHSAAIGTDSGYASQGHFIPVTELESDVYTDLRACSRSQLEHALQMKDLQDNISKAQNLLLGLARHTTWNIEAAPSVPALDRYHPWDDQRAKLGHWNDEAFSWIQLMWQDCFRDVPEIHSLALYNEDLEHLHHLLLNGKACLEIRIAHSQANRKPSSRTCRTSLCRT